MRTEYPPVKIITISRGPIHRPVMSFIWLQLSAKIDSRKKGHVGDRFTELLRLFADVLELCCYSLTNRRLSPIGDSYLTSVA
jgi:hypothetical protein